MSYRFAVGDPVRVVDNASFGAGQDGTIISIEYIPDSNDQYDNAEYMVDFDEPADNPNYLGNEEWETPTYTEGYFNDNELELRVRKPKKRTSGFGKFINRIEDASGV